MDLADALVGEADVVVRPPADLGKGRANRIADSFRRTLVQHFEHHEGLAWRLDGSLVEQRVGERWRRRLRAQDYPFLRRDRGRRWRGIQHIGVEAELLPADANDVGTREPVRALDLLAVHEHAVRAGVAYHVAVLGRRQLGVAARDLVPRHDDVTARVAADDEPLLGNRVLLAIHERYEPPPRRGHLAGRAGAPSSTLGGNRL